MNSSEIEQIIKEIADELTGLRFGKVFQLDPMSVAIDFFPHSGRYLFISFGPSEGQTHLIRRRLKILERESIHPTAFANELKKTFNGRELIRVRRISKSSVICLDLDDASDGTVSIAIQTGRRRPNVFLLDRDQRVTLSARTEDDPGRRSGDIFQPVEDEMASSHGPAREQVESLSDLLDAEYITRRKQERFDQLVADARRALTIEIKKRVKLINNLDGDLLKHGDPETWKRYGDLLLANIGNLRTENEKFIVTDYFDPNMAEIEVPRELSATPAEMADIFFKRYAKARNGVAAISERRDSVEAEITALRSKLHDVEAAAAAEDEAALTGFLPAKKPQPTEKSRKKESVEIRGVRSFISSDGFEILVGKKAVDNDHLTFRIARSLDTWLHAADYPGSHVVIRNPGKKEIPPKTLIEASQLAAFYSDAREMPKAAVRYTLKKHVNKPRKAAPGLVSLSSFKTILVEPKIGDLRST